MPFFLFARGIMYNKKGDFVLTEFQDCTFRVKIITSVSNDIFTYLSESELKKYVLYYNPNNANQKKKKNQTKLSS